MFTSFKSIKGPTFLSTILKEIVRVKSIIIIGMAKGNKSVHPIKQKNRKLCLFKKQMRNTVYSGDGKVVIMYKVNLLLLTIFQCWLSSGLPCGEDVSLTLAGPTLRVLK